MPTEAPTLAALEAAHRAATAEQERRWGLWRSAEAAADRAWQDWKQAAAAQDRAFEALEEARRGGGA